jgi:glycosyltransferase involved in cell wall biosynthesis
MRTLAVFHLGGVTGPQRSLPQVMRWLGEQGTVDFIVPEHGLTEDEYRELGQVSVLRYATLSFARGPREGARLARRLGREARMFRHELRRRRPDLVVAVTTVLPALVLAARLERIPVVVYAAELHESSPLRRFWGALLVRGTAVLADGVVCCSELVARQFPRRIRTPLAVAYPPVGAAYGNGEGDGNGNGDRDAARARYGVEDARPCIAVIGSISRGRGQDVAVRALPAILDRHPETRLLIVGAPHPRPVDLEFARRLRALAAELEVEDAVVYAEPTDSIAEVYAAADLVLNPARHPEAFGRVAPEALVAGTPVIATKVGAIPEVVRDGVDALLVEPDDAEALAGAVALLVEDPARAARMVEAGRARVLERFGHEQDLAAWQTVVEGALGYRVAAWNRATGASR